MCCKWIRINFPSILETLNVPNTLVIFRKKYYSKILRTFVIQLCTVITFLPKYIQALTVLTTE